MGWREIEALCHKALAETSFLPEQPAPVDIELFAETCFTNDVGYEEMEHLGYTAFDANGRVLEIRVSTAIDDGSTIGVRRTRATWAHECGHCLFHSAAFVRETKSSVPAQPILVNRKVSPIFTLSEHEERLREYQANQAIGSLLLPRSLVLTALNLRGLLIKSSASRFPTIRVEDSNDAMVLISETFDVSRTVAKHRLAKIFPIRKTSQLKFSFRFSR